MNLMIGHTNENFLPHFPDQTTGKVKTETSSVKKARPDAKRHYIKDIIKVGVIKVKLCAGAQSLFRTKNGKMCGNFS